MILPPPPAGLPVVSTRTQVLDVHHKFIRQETARGDVVFIRESMGELREIAIIPIDAKPFLRWQEVTPLLQPLLDKELPGWEPTRPVRNDDWIRYDELNWAKEIDALLARVLAWYMENAGREAVVR